MGSSGINTGKQVLSTKMPLEPMNYDNYRQRLKRHLDSEEFKAMGVLPEDYGTHSFRIGGSSVMGADQIVSPVFIQKNMRHKNIQSTPVQGDLQDRLTTGRQRQ